MDIEVINKALVTLHTQTGISAAWKPAPKNKKTFVDGTLYLRVGKHKLTFPAEVKKNITVAQIPALNALKEKMGKLLVLTPELSQRDYQTLQGLGIFFLDTAGNAYIQEEAFFLMIEGKKTGFKAPTDTRAFSKGGLKVIFQLFLNSELLNRSMREMAQAAEVSLDTVHKTITALKNLRYIIEETRDQYIWVNKKELLDRWVTEYATRLKPSQFIQRFEFLDDNDFDNWHNFQFKNHLTCWSGEAAADLLTNNLKPAELQLYTFEDNMELIKRYRIMPKKAGTIAVYRRFWPAQEEEKHIAPPLLVYADLVTTGNRRNIETAQTIYEQYLQNQFQTT